MATHTKNSQPATRIVVSDGSTINVDAINVQKDLPEDIIHRFIPQYFSLNYNLIDPETKTFPLSRSVHNKFLSHVNMLVDQNYINRFSNPNNLIDSEGNSLYGFAIGLNNDSVVFSEIFYDELQLTSEIFLIYTPA
jgi:hypothetical protein